MRLDCLKQLDHLAQNPTRDEASEQSLQAQLDKDFRPQQTDAAEAKLLQRLPEIFHALHHTPELQSAHIRQVLATITHGQMLDLQRFPSDGALHALRTASELDEYTYLVAGCVGGFWTKLCAEAEPPTLSGEKSVEDMIVLGIRYGKGLQLVNILRDVGQDLGDGPLLFSVGGIEATGTDAGGGAKADPEKLLPVMIPWRKLCREHLACGLEYLRGPEAWPNALRNGAAAVARGAHVGADWKGGLARTGARRESLAYGSGEDHGGSGRGFDEEVRWDCAGLVEKHLRTAT